MINALYISLAVLWIVLAITMFLGFFIIPSSILIRRRRQRGAKMIRQVTGS